MLCSESPFTTAHEMAASADAFRSQLLLRFSITKPTREESECRVIVMLKNGNELRGVVGASDALVALRGLLPACEIDVLDVLVISLAEQVKPLRHATPSHATPCHATPAHPHPG